MSLNNNIASKPLDAILTEKQTTCIYQNVALIMPENREFIWMYNKSSNLISLKCLECNTQVFKYQERAFAFKRFTKHMKNHALAYA